MVNNRVLKAHGLQSSLLVLLVRSIVADLGINYREDRVIVVGRHESCHALSHDEELVDVVTLLVKESTCVVEPGSESRPDPSEHSLPLTEVFE
jgi:hypothetical protein